MARCSRMVDTVTLDRRAAMVCHFSQAPRSGLLYWARVACRMRGSIYDGGSSGFGWGALVVEGEWRLFLWPFYGFLLRC